jgi:hypothetical protein
MKIGRKKRTSLSDAEIKPEDVLWRNAAGMVIAGKVSRNWTHPKPPNRRDVALHSGRLAGKTFDQLAEEFKMRAQRAQQIFARVERFNRASGGAHEGHSD